jgi:hypothetical protein
MRHPSCAPRARRRAVHTVFLLLACVGIAGALAFTLDSMLRRRPIPPIAWDNDTAPVDSRMPDVLVRHMRTEEEMHLSALHRDKWAVLVLSSFT